jgi:hypothetical protein
MPFCRNLVDPCSHIFPILRERAAHMPYIYKYLESFKTILSDFLTAFTGDRFSVEGSAARYPLIKPRRPTILDRVRCTQTPGLPRPCSQRRLAARNDDMSHDTTCFTEKLSEPSRVAITKAGSVRATMPTSTASAQPLSRAAASNGGMAMMTSTAGRW